MKLLAFEIHNFRSIVNSGWSSLANDNITTLIGQNESGKTSVLESLFNFYNGVIHDDVMRSDQTAPVVKCKFHIQDKHPTEYIDKKRVPEAAFKLLEKKNEIILTRQWQLDKSSTLTLGDDDILEQYTQYEEKNKKIEEDTLKQIEETFNNSDDLFHKLKTEEDKITTSKVELAAKRKNLDQEKKALRKEKQAENKIHLEHSIESLEQAISEAEKDLKAQLDKHDQLKKETEVLSEKMSLSKRVMESKSKRETAIRSLEKAENDLDAKTKQYELTSVEKQRKKALNLAEQAKIQRFYAEEAKNESEEAYFNALYTAYGIFNNKELSIAEKEARDKIAYEKRRYTLEELGKEIFNYVPVFEFFEDFSSLLPNKIDLEDIIANNNNVEGYKAVINFLTIAGLEPNFFIEKNNRILKQKIENLNGEITINFQDYWSQNIGKKDKIRLNFELEHYDYTIPEKKGKPYLEFWIKDQNERLYPKQRSRGVRWFLSFYLELKATALGTDKNRVLLIDEPGLSLHAKAQDDVLKVFEDLKESMQIVYCTHSPHLVNADKLYRVLAVQRADEENERSETTIIDAKSLHSASNDTLSPIYSLMGIRLGEQQLIGNQNNVIVEDTISFHYLNVLQKLVGELPGIHYIPSTGLANIPVMANILTGWKLDYKVLLFGNGKNEAVIKELNNTFFYGDQGKKKILLWDNFDYIEDVFSTIDFKKYVLNERVGITEKNSEYIEENRISRAVLAANFVARVFDDKLILSDFDKETQENIKGLFTLLS